MPEPIENVRPGDLITADYLNRIVAHLRDLEERVIAIEGQEGSVVITGVLPAGPVRVGDTIEIIGRNFDFSIGAHRVYFNSTRATSFTPDSGDTRLVTVVPNVPGVSEVGTQVILTVGNLSTSDTTEITVRRAVAQQEGNIALSFQGTVPETIEASQSLDVIYRLDSNALLPATVTITPTISIPDWQDQLEVVSSTDTILTARTITLEPGANTTFSIRLDPVPADSGETPFTLTVVATAPGLTSRQDGPRNFVVGSAVEQPDPTVTIFDFNTAVPAGVVSGNTIRLAAGSTATVQLRAEFTAPPTGSSHQYTFSAEVTPSTTAWNTILPSASPIFASPITFTITAAGTQFVALDINRPAGTTPPTATLTCRLQRIQGGQTFNRTRSFTLEAA